MPKNTGDCCFRELTHVILTTLCLVAQSPWPLCNPLDCSPAPSPDSSAHGIFLARTLEWVAMPSCRGGGHKPRDWIFVSCVSCIAGGFLTCWAMGEALNSHDNSIKYYFSSFLKRQLRLRPASSLSPQPPLLVSIRLLSRLLTVCLLSSPGHLLQGETSPTPAPIPLRVRLPAGLAIMVFRLYPHSSVGSWDRVH